MSGLSQWYERLKSSCPLPPHQCHAPTRIYTSQMFFIGKIVYVATPLKPCRMFSTPTATFSYRQRQTPSPVFGIIGELLCSNSFNKHFLVPMADSNLQSFHSYS